MRHLSAHPPGDPPGGWQQAAGLRGDAPMNTSITSLSRRKFLATAAAAGGGLALGIDAGGIRSALSQIAIGGAGNGNELGVWVFIKPNEDVVIRIARSEMGQGSLTGLAQLVAEELDCDWS